MAVVELFPERSFEEQVQEQIAHRNYALVEIAGQGSFGVVYKITTPSPHNDTLCGKVLAIPGQEKPTVLQAVEFLGIEGILKREKYPQQFPHLNIVNVVESFSIIVDGVEMPFILYHWIEGDTLEKILETGPIVKNKNRIMQDVAAAVACVHNHGYVHRDIKPANIKWTGEQAILLDFTIAEQIDKKGRIIFPNPAKQSIVYAAPETEQQNYDARRADVWSLGLVLCEILTGKNPQKEYIPIQSILYSIPRRYRPIVNKCLQEEPNKRYNDGQQVYRALKRAEWHYTRAAIKLVTPFMLLALTAVACGGWFILKEKRSMLYLNQCRESIDTIDEPIQAEKYCRKAVDWDNTSPDAYLYLGHSLVDQGRYDEAKQAYIHANNNGNSGDPKDDRPIIPSELKRKALELKNQGEITNATFLFTLAEELSLHR
ncbi:MAG: protein kinase [Candidatus Woesearchaeota archaeon]